MYEDIYCSWHFREYRENEDKLQGANDPIIQKFKENFYNSLVRESIQNSMDAKDENGIIEVKYELGKISKTDYPALFGLKEHVVACKETHGGNNRAQEIYSPMVEYIDADELDIITISDYGTVGMPYYPGEIYQNPFLAFINSDGQSVKTTTKDGVTVSNGGSFGIGKGAYFLMSPVRSLLVSTMVNDAAHSTYFEGVSRLCTHDIGENHYYHMGFYCVDGKTPVSGDEIPVQFRRTSPGTSIFLVGKYKDLGSNQNVEEEIEKAVITNFWLAIYNEKLTVTVGKRKQINRESLEGKMLALFPDEYSKWNPINYYRAYTTPQDDRNHFKFETKDDEYLGHCELYIRVGEPGKKDMITCMRDMMMLIQTIPSPRQHHAGISGTFICLGEPGNGNFELTEDESHSTWSSKGKQGEAKRRANELLQRMETFIGDSVDSIIGVDGDKIDVTIDSISETCSNDVIEEGGVGGNPFGVVKEAGSHIKEGFDRFSIPEPIKEREKQKEERGDTIFGPALGSKDGDTSTITAGPITITKIQYQKPHPKPGKKKKRVDLTFEDGAKEYQIVPTYFDVAAHLEKGEWVHTVYLEFDEDACLYDKAYIDVSVGQDSSTQEDSKVDIRSARIDGKPIIVDRSRVRLDKIEGKNLTIDLVFRDNIRHSLNLG